MAEEKGKKEEKKEEKGKGKGAEEEPAEGEGEKKKKPLPVKIILIVSLVVLIIALVVVVSWKVATMEREGVYGEGKPEKPQEVRKTVAALKMFRLGSKEIPDFKIVISDKGEQHNLKCVIWLGYPKDYEKHHPEFFEELGERMPQLREIVYRVMGNKTLEELQYRNFDHVKDELLSRINEVLESGTIVDVVYEEYIIQ